MRQAKNEGKRRKSILSKGIEIEQNQSYKQWPSINECYEPSTQKDEGQGMTCSI
jgi:hypothetical protein